MIDTVPVFARDPDDGIWYRVIFDEEMRTAFRRIDGEPPKIGLRFDLPACGTMVGATLKQTTR